ncbi:MAG TPA: phosphatase PAP2 family protein [Vicinamibacterales bacterium]|nr:phosphatase PAP2 family protein [Vicinamibacterales bacterium]
MIHRKPLVATVLFVLATSTTALAQAPAEAPPPDRNPFLYLFHNLVLDAKRLPSVETAMTLGIGSGLAFAVHPADDTVAEGATAGEPRDFYRVGSTIGDGWAQVGFAVGTYATGFITRRQSMAHFGADLVRAQAINAALTQGLKFAIQRERPDNPGGTSYSMPSGHTSSAFATSAVVWRHYGWKAGLPASAISAWVGAGRVQLGQHFLSDVVFGAAIGTLSGRTVTIGHGRRVVSVAPAAVRGGGAVVFTLVER